MHITTLRKVGGSVMLAVPPALLDVLHLKSDARVGISVDGGRLVVEPEHKPHYSLDELLAQCDPSAPLSAEELEWIDAPAAGKELL